MPADTPIPPLPIQAAMPADTPEPPQPIQGAMLADTPEPRLPIQGAMPANTPEPPQPIEGAMPADTPERPSPIQALPGDTLEAHRPTQGMPAVLPTQPPIPIQPMATVNQTVLPAALLATQPPVPEPAVNQIVLPPAVTISGWPSPPAAPAPFWDCEAQEPQAPDFWELWFGANPEHIGRPILLIGSQHPASYPCPGRASPLRHRENPLRKNSTLGEHLPLRHLPILDHDQHPPLGPRRSAREWTLPTKIRSVAGLRCQDGSIWRVDGEATLPHEGCTPLIVVLGPLFKKKERLAVEDTKLKYTHNLIRRADEHVERRMTEYLEAIGSMEALIRQRYDPVELEDKSDGTGLVETMVLDSLFIIEVLVIHWMGKREPGPPSLELINFTTQPLRWEPKALRLDLIVVQNQIPYFVLKKLFCMTNIPELGEHEDKPTQLKQMILDYLIGDADDALAEANYRGPIHHILHLVHLHLTFSSFSAQAVNPAPRLLSVNWTLDKLAQQAKDLRAFYKRTLSCSSNLLPVGWKRWKVIPPLRELVRVGVKLKRAETAWFIQVKFDKGVLEIPPFSSGRYHIRLLTNLVVMEMSGCWPPDNRLFCSYVRFMAELIKNKKDAKLLFKKGII
uniref:Uncharacterized protein n=1 Tax=Hordeum vulgare subsp. vulgare TaxID=112509 RepID=A0A8I7BB59_HORVV